MLIQFQKQSAQPQVPTPPHPQTQSPIAIQQPIMNIPQQVIAAGPGQIYVPQPSMFLNSIGPVQPQQNQLQRTAKRGRIVCHIFMPYVAKSVVWHPATGAGRNRWAALCLCSRSVRSLEKDFMPEAQTSDFIYTVY